MYLSLLDVRINYPPLILNSTNVQSAISQTHLGMILDSILDHVDDNNNKCNQRLYNAVIIMAYAIECASRDNLFQELLL